MPLVTWRRSALVGALGGRRSRSSPTQRRFSRFTAFLDIEGNKDHLAYQTYQGLLSIANGGMTGSGIGGSNVKLGYLPLAHSDFIFAVIADELGFVGSVAVIGGFVPARRGSGSRPRSPHPTGSGMLLAGGIAAWFGVQAIINLGGVIGLMPVTGLTLPFFSAGGSSLFVSMVAAGLLLNVARRAVTAPPRIGRRHAVATRRSSATGESMAGTFAVVTGGGTAGHVLPALAIAEALVAGGHDPATIHYVGRGAGIETRLLPGTPFPHTFLDVVGLQRSFVATATSRSLPKLWRARRAAIAPARELRPPRSSSASAATPACPRSSPPVRLGIPVVVVSYDLLPGRASRLAARRAAACAVAFPDSPLPRADADRAHPSARRSSTSTARRDRAAARRRLGLPADRFVVAVMGGSQGSGVLNAAVAALVSSVVGRPRPRRAPRRRRALPRRCPGRPRRRRPASCTSRSATSRRCHCVYAAADLLVGRGGAGTVAEVAVTGTPAVLVPWAGSAEDHQTLNVTLALGRRCRDPPGRARTRPARRR